MRMKERTLPQIGDLTWLCDLAFDITGHSSDLKLKLQKQEQLMN